MRTPMVLFGLIAVAAFALRCPAADIVVEPSFDQLSRAYWVTEAKVTQRLSDKEWLFRVDHQLFPQGPRAARPQAFVGWWEGRRLEGIPVIVVIAPQPVNTSLLREGAPLLVLADRDFHLVGVYIVGAGGITREHLEQCIFDLHQIRMVATTFLEQLQYGRWERAASWMTAGAVKAALTYEGGLQEQFQRWGIDKVVAREGDDVTLSVRTFSSSGARVEVVTQHNDRDRTISRGYLELEGRLGGGPWEVAGFSRER